MKEGCAQNLAFCFSDLGRNLHIASWSVYELGICGGVKFVLFACCLVASKSMDVLGNDRGFVLVALIQCIPIVFLRME